jgi:hypothetical protein
MEGKTCGCDVDAELLVSAKSHVVSLEELAWHLYKVGVFSPCVEIVLERWKAIVLVNEVQ